MPTRHELLAQIELLRYEVNRERAENKKYGVKHLSPGAHKILIKIENIEEVLMDLPS